MLVQLNKQLILEAASGPWDQGMHASAEARNLLNASARENFKNNPIQYFANWYVRGPLSHLPSEMYGKMAEMLYSLLKHTESKPITSVEDFQKELQKLDGPWNKEKDALRRGFETMDKALTEIKNKHFMHWLLNPFVKGDIQSRVNFKLREDLQLELNKYGDGKGTLSNQEAIDNTRDIENKRYLDEMGKEKKESEEKKESKESKEEKK